MNKITKFMSEHLLGVFVAVLVLAAGCISLFASFLTFFVIFVIAIIASNNDDSFPIFDVESFGGSAFLWKALWTIIL